MTTTFSQLPLHQRILMKRRSLGYTKTPEQVTLSKYILPSHGTLAKLADKVIYNLSEREDRLYTNLKASVILLMINTKDVIRPNDYRELGYSKGHANRYMSATKQIFDECLPANSPKAIQSINIDSLISRYL